MKDLRDKVLPPNISVSEFFIKTGDYLGNPQAQQSCISANYTHVVCDMMAQGVNVLAHAIASKANHSGALRLSLSSNPDLTLEVMEKYRATGKPITAVGVVNQHMHFMLNSAEVGANLFDIVVTDPASTHAVFAPPNNKINLGDYAIGLHSHSLVVDGGILQIGIGSLGDAISQALILRDSHNANYRRMMDALCVDRSAGRELNRFGHGLHGCLEMFVNGFLKLMKVGIVRREVFSDLALQSLLNEGAIAGTDVTPQTLRALVDAGRLNLPLSVVDLHFLQEYGVVDANVTLRDGWLTLGEHRFSAKLLQQDAFDGVCQHMLGTLLRGGIAMTGGFFLGPTDFYETLRTMPSQAQAAKLHPWAETGHLLDFPYDTDLTPDELSMVGALKKRQHASEHLAEILSLVFKSLWDSKEMPATYQVLLGLSDAYSLKDSVLRRLLAGNL